MPHDCIHSFVFCFLPALSLLPQVVPPLFLSLVENGIPLSSEKASPKVEESESYPDKESL